MIDSVTVGFLGIVLLVVAVLLVIFKMFAKEKSFEEAYGPDALRLLTDEKSSKQKSKPAKARNRGGERKKETVNEKEESRLKSEVEPHSNSEIAQSSRTSESNEFAKQDVKHAKREKKSKEKYFDESKLREEITSEKRIQANDVQEEVTEAKIEMINAAVKQELSTEEVRVENSEKKVRKRNRPRRADDNNVSEIDKEANRQGTSLTGEGSEQEKSGLTREKKSEDRDKAKKSSQQLEPISVERVMSHLTSVDQVDPAYLSFLVNHLSDAGAQKMRLQEENKLLRKQLVEKEKFANQVIEKANMVAKRDAEISQLRDSLSEEKKKYKLFEQSVCNELSTNVQEKKFLQRQNDQLEADMAVLKEELKKVQATVQKAPPIDTSVFQKQIDLLKAEIAQSKNHSAQLEAELSNCSKSYLQLQNEYQKAQKVMGQTASIKEQQIKNLTTERKQLEGKVEETLKQMHELDLVVSARGEEYERTISALNETQQRLKREAADEVNSLKRRLSEMEIEKEKLISKARELEHNQSDGQNEVAKLQSKLALVEKENAEMQARIIECETKKSDAAVNAEQRLSELNARITEKSTLIAQLESELKDAEARNWEKIRKLEHELSNARSEISSLEKIKAEHEIVLTTPKENESTNRIAELESELSRAQEKIVALENAKASEIKNTGDLLDDERIKLVTVNPVRSSSVLTDGVLDVNEVQKLKADLEEQVRRNNELRERNYKVVETAQKQDATARKLIESAEKKWEQSEKECSMLRSETVKVLTSLMSSDVELSVDPMKSADSETYRTWLNQVASVVRKQSGPKSSHFPPSTSNKKQSGLNEDEVDKLKKEVERYRTALVDASSAFDMIEREVSEREAKYEHEIALLRADLNKQVGELRNRLNSEQEHGKDLSDQAEKLRSLLDECRGSEQVGGIERRLQKDESASGSDQRSGEEDWEVVEKLS